VHVDALPVDVLLPIAIGVVHVSIAASAMHPSISMLGIMAVIQRNQIIVAAVSAIAQLVIFFAAPVWHQSRGSSDEAAWVQLWMAPVLAIGIIAVIGFLVFRWRVLKVAIILIPMALLVVGAGLHPR